MKNLIPTLLVLVFLHINTTSAQEEIKTTSKKKTAQRSWILGLGYNFVDDSGGGIHDLFSIKSDWNYVPYPSRLSFGRYFENGLGIEFIGTYNKYKKGKIIEGVVNDTEKSYAAFDARLSYDLNKIVGYTGWLDPYVGVGYGYTSSDNVPKSTFNATVGFRTWITERFGLDFNSTGKWKAGKEGTNHLQHAAGIVYRFGMEGLSRKEMEELASLKEIEEANKRSADSIAAVNREKEALAERMAEEREKNRLAEIEKAKIEKENQRKLGIDKEISELGYVFFDLNSSYLNEKSKNVLNDLITLLNRNPGIVLKVTSHTDSRGLATYNKWLSKRRADNTIAYLVEQGIAAERLMSASYGEELLLNECDDNTYCPEEKHKINRRSEFIILKY